MLPVTGKHNIQVMLPVTGKHNIQVMLPVTGKTQYTGNVTCHR